MEEILQAYPGSSEDWLELVGWRSFATLGGTFLFGSASDKPFHAGRDLTLMAILFATVPARNDRDDWSFSLFYSPTSQLPYPLPGIAYVWKPDETFEAKIGLPAGLEWGAQ